MEQAEPIIIAVVQQLLGFALCYLEKSKFHSDDFTMQGLVSMVLELCSYMSMRLGWRQLLWFFREWSR
ncbi:hypothetical protein Q3G72_010712 [Acer saccharum]|nr:hypothetical protein Q3G72_010712 [Acer saccharum]